MKVKDLKSLKDCRKFTLHIKTGSEHYRATIDSDFIDYLTKEVLNAEINDIRPQDCNSVGVYISAKPRKKRDASLKNLLYVIMQRDMIEVEMYISKKSGTGYGYFSLDFIDFLTKELFTMPISHSVNSMHRLESRIKMREQGE